MQFSQNAVWDCFQELCSQQDDQTIQLFLSTLIRSGISGERALSSEFAAKFNFDKTDHKIYERIQNTFNLSISAQFSGELPFMQVKIDEAEWEFLIETYEDEKHRVGLELKPNYENPLVDDLIDRFVLINGKNEVYLDRFFSGSEWADLSE